MSHDISTHSNNNDGDAGAGGSEDVKKKSMTATTTSGGGGAPISEGGSIRSQASTVILPGRRTTSSSSPSSQPPPPSTMSTTTTATKSTNHKVPLRASRLRSAKAINNSNNKHSPNHGLLRVRGTPATAAVTSNRIASFGVIKGHGAAASAAPSVTASRLMRGSAGSGAGRRRPRTELETKLAGAGVLILSCIYLLFLWKTQGFLDRLEERNGDNSKKGIRSGFNAPMAFNHLRTALRGSLDAAFAHHGNSSNVSKTMNHPVVDSVPDEPEETKKNDQQAELSARLADPIFDFRDGRHHRRFLIFEPFTGGQGTGNIIAGLLSAHLLGFEFDRIVCVNPRYEDFHLVFAVVHPDAARYCPRAIELAYVDGNSRRTFNDEPFIQLINFMSPPDECWLQATMASDEPVRYMTGNTYPRWPVVPDNFFFRYYAAKPALLNKLPYDPAYPPPIVVHLRQPDSWGADPRKGLDDASVDALGKILPANSSTFLVTNRPEWYDIVHTKYGWSHPEWNEVVHSAMDRSWGTRDHGADKAETPVLTVDHVEQMMQMWADWYTILTAKKVYHTHSDFSISAIHWMNIDSKTLQGVDPATGILGMIDESWRIDGETARLRDRTPGGPGTSELRLCTSEELLAIRSRQQHAGVGVDPAHQVQRMLQEILDDASPSTTSNEQPDIVNQILPAPDATSFTGLEEIGIHSAQELTEPAHGEGWQTQPKQALQSKHLHIQLDRRIVMPLNQKEPDEHDKEFLEQVARTHFQNGNMQVLQPPPPVLQSSRSVALAGGNPTNEFIKKEVYEKQSHENQQDKDGNDFLEQGARAHFENGNIQAQQLPPPLVQPLSSDTHTGASQSKEDITEQAYENALSQYKAMISQNHLDDDISRAMMGASDSVYRNRNVSLTISQHSNIRVTGRFNPMDRQDEMDDVAFI